MRPSRLQARTSLQSRFHINSSLKPCHSFSRLMGIMCLSIKYSKLSDKVGHTPVLKYFSCATLTKISINSNLISAPSGLSPWSSPTSTLTAMNRRSRVDYETFLSWNLAFLENPVKISLSLAGKILSQAINICSAFRMGKYLVTTFWIFFISCSSFTNLGIFQKVKSCFKQFSMILASSTFQSFQTDFARSNLRMIKFFFRFFLNFGISSSLNFEMKVPG